MVGVDTCGGEGRWIGVGNTKLVEGDRESNYTQILVCEYIHTYIYVYIYIMSIVRGVEPLHMPLWFTYRQGGGGELLMAMSNGFLCSPP